MAPTDGVLDYFWSMSEHWTEGRRWVEEALTRADETGRSGTPCEFLQAAWWRSSMRSSDEPWLSVGPERAIVVPLPCFSPEKVGKS